MAQIIDGQSMQTHSEMPRSDYSRQEAEDFGRSLRDKTSRISHSHWHQTATRKDPVDVLIESSKGRQANLIPIRYGRMLQSPFSFFRGAASIMAADLATTPNTDIYVQACGDCHLVNFGCFATPERKIVFDINDFDETLPAPWEWDLKRLATSFIIASKQNNFSSADAKEISRTCVRSYREHTAKFSKMSPLKIWYSNISAEDIMNLVNDERANKRFAHRIEKARNQTLTVSDFPELTELKYGKSYIKDNPPLIYHRVDVHDTEYYEGVEKGLEEYINTLGEEKRILLDQYRFQDIAIKVVGIGSVGTLCGVSLWMSANNDPLFLQIKEARESVLEPYSDKSKFDNYGKRIVIGQKLMQATPDIFLGWTNEFNGRYFYVRQLRDMKIKPLVEIFDEKLMKNYAELCGWALARAHARSGKSSIIYGYMGNSNKFDDAIAQFAVAYAKQNEQDFAAFKTALKEDKLEAFVET